MQRNYKKEYENYHSSEEQKKDRAGRNGARRMLKKKHGNSLLGKDVDHKDRNPRNNSMSNLRVQSKSANRSRNQ
jgi:hypothetical protein